MLKKPENFEEYFSIYNELNKKIDETFERNDMIIFDMLSKYMRDLKEEYPEFEKQRLTCVND